MIVLLLLSVAARADWESELIAPSSHRSSLAVDDAGTVHVAYDTPTNEVWYSVRSGSQWDLEKLANDVSWPALRLTAASVPWVVYGQTGPGAENLFLARSDNGEWTVEDTGIFGHDASLALDSDENPHLGYNVDPILWYAHKESSAWQEGGPDAASYLAFQERTPIEVSSSGTVYLGFVNQLPQRNVRLATWTGEVWIEQPVADGENVSLDLDENQRLHICLTDDQAQLEHRITATGTPAIVDGDRIVGETSMVVDALGVIHIAYESSEGLRYARSTADGWALERIAASGANPSIGVGPGSVHVSYEDQGILWHAWQARAVPSARSSVGRVKVRFGAHR